MDSKNFRVKYASGPGPFVISTPIRLLGAIALILAVCSNGGCLASQMRATSNRPVDASMTVFARASIEQHSMDSVCLFPCTSSPEMAEPHSGSRPLFRPGLSKDALFGRSGPCHMRSSRIRRHYGTPETRGAHLQCAHHSSI